MLELVAAFICLTTLLTYVNFRFIGLPPTIGVMVTALVFSLILQGLSVLGYAALPRLRRSMSLSALLCRNAK